ncbi:isoleucine--tRNA ligase [Rhodoluna lacicola]|uniref:Isoleucine--tRNA ligase n=1 Tax=Rhodoluna lacicola TaxID=529884 RepID=A0A060JF60_9MICO|nr:isoleucine--tRNA ligase [Rhodoluna lacicola]AIC47395.1 isoleucyl-tRNA synthetase [Rhodoluna lacicola]
MYPKNHDSTAPAREGVNPSPSFPAVEQQILNFWAKDGTFQASIDQRKESDAEEFVFYDGPPFANGLPHYGHLLTGYAKDMVPRFKTMQGYRVERRFGWDTHGLPAEVEAERQLGISGRPEIEKYGIDKFNDYCRTSVLKYTEEWRSYITRQARWVDFDNDYKTLDTSYTESVLWAFSELYKKGLIYEGFKVLAYCWRCETPLSNHELRMDDEVYKNRQDQTLTVTFPVSAGQKLEGVRVLAWTTTPWTLPTNFALAVGPEIEYAIVPAGAAGAGDGGAPGTKYLLSKSLVGGYAKDLGYESAEDAVAAIAETHLGSALAGIKYERLFDYYVDAEKFNTDNAWQILVDDYVGDGDGTGIVHQAPAYGEDDQRVCNDAGIPTYVSINERGEFNSIVSDFVGQHVFDANKPISQHLKSAGRVLRQASYEHSYPHCYRCKNPLIYKAVSSWFVETTKLRDRMLELNQEIDWTPDHTKDGSFGKWLENVRDWAISRNRFWGAPIPVWKSDDPNYPRVDVYGSMEELERDFGVRPSDFHRPVIDELTRPNPDDPTGKSTMRRVPEVLDCWFESGSMPFAQAHYPFENREWFDSHNPGDYIVEYVGQTRGWFYTLHVLSTALFDRPAFKSAISHGIILGNDGQKMSKSLRNYPDVNEVFDRDGADAMRWFLLSSPILRGGNLIVTEQGIREGVRQVLLPLWNTWYFFSLYANASNYEAKWSTASEDLLDRYLLSKTHDLVNEVEAHLNKFDSYSASASLRDFADVLTNWYVRRSRDRFWEGSEAAFDTLYTVLEIVSRVAAPLLPMITEEIWRGLTGGRSVHLESWPDASKLPHDAALVEAMDQVRTVSSVASSLRKAASLRVRLPLAKLTVVTKNVAGLNQFAEIIAEELNVKNVELVEMSLDSTTEFGVIKRVTVNSRAAGPRIGKSVQAVIQAAKSGDWSEVDGTVIVGGIALIEGEYEIDLVADTSTNTDGQATDHIGILPTGGFLILDGKVTAELAAEGLARDVIRAVQSARKDADFDVSDRIKLTLKAADDVLAAVAEHSELVKSETLTVELETISSGTLANSVAVGEGQQVEVHVAVVAAK